MNIDLSGRRAIVCGSTQGIGQGAALALAHAGASITLLARNEASLQLTMNKLEKSSAQHHEYLVADFFNNQDLKKVVEQYATSVGSVDILINNTGGPPAGDIIKAAPEEFIKAFQAHLIANHILTQTFSPLMIKNQYGRIINIISTSVKSPIPGLGVSNTIRAAVANWAKTLAGELGKDGITVNNILPGFINTGRLSSLIKTRADASDISIEEQEQNMISTIPAGRFGTVEDIGMIIVFLASPEASYINGINVPVDGGKTSNL